MVKKFAKLRGAMVAADIDATHLARWLGCSTKQISMLLNGHAEWRLSDMYKALDLLRVERERLYEYFPPEGEAVELAPAGTGASPRRVLRLMSTPGRRA